jgi:hypothetical protein
MTSLSKLSGHDKLLCGIYACIAAVALVATWANNIAYFRSEDNGGLIGFFGAGYTNYATSSLTNDLFLVGLAAIVLMIVEARRVGVRYVWAYIVLGFVIAISVTFPLFLLARQLRLAASQASQPASSDH